MLIYVAYTATQWEYGQVYNIINPQWIWNEIASDSYLVLTLCDSFTSYSMYSRGPVSPWVIQWMHYMGADLNERLGKTSFIFVCILRSPKRFHCVLWEVGLDWSIVLVRRGWIQTIVFNGACWQFLSNLFTQAFLLPFNPTSVPPATKQAAQAAPLTTQMNTPLQVH